MNMQQMNNLLEEVSAETRNISSEYIKVLEMQKPYLNRTTNASAFLRSYVGGFSKLNHWKNLKKYCLFIGHPRSGHSLIAALLDAHPNALFSDELDTLKFFNNGFSKEQIYYLILENSRLNAKNTRQIGGYSYRVSNQCQGQANNLKVIGDKHGPATTVRLYSNPKLIDSLERKVGIPVKYIHVIRNPYDNIKTIARKDFGGLELQTAIELYFLLCKASDEIRKRINNDDILEVRHEVLIDNPLKILREICDFLSIDTPSNYLEDCAHLVYKSPHKSRYELQWTPKLVDLVRKNIDNYPFLSNYCYEE